MFAGTWFGLQLAATFQLPPLVLVQVMVAEWAKWLPKAAMIKNRTKASVCRFIEVSRQFEDKELSRFDGADVVCVMELPRAVKDVGSQRQPVGQWQGEIGAGQHYT